MRVLLGASRLFTLLSRARNVAPLTIFRCTNAAQNSVSLGRPAMALDSQRSCGSRQSAVTPLVAGDT
jgi:hypothetical protein